MLPSMVDQHHNCNFFSKTPIQADSDAKEMAESIRVSKASVNVNRNLVVKNHRGKKRQACQYNSKLLNKIYCVLTCHGHKFGMACKEISLSEAQTLHADYRRLLSTRCTSSLVITGSWPDKMT